MLRYPVLALALAAALATSPAVAQSPQPAAPTTASPSAAAPRLPLIDLNAASKDELDALPGIGPVRAEAIIKGRPYRGKDELVRKKVIPESVYEGIKERVVARQS